MRRIWHSSVRKIRGLMPSGQEVQQRDASVDEKSCFSYLKFIAISRLSQVTPIAADLGTTFRQTPLSSAGTVGYIPGWIDCST